MDETLDELKLRLREVRDIGAIAALLHWDQATYMPPGGAPARAQQSATLRRILHERATDAEIGRLLDRLEPWSSTLDPDSDAAALVRVARRDFDRATKVPTSLVARLSAHGAASYQAWTQARPANDFAVVRPYLEETLELNRELAGCFSGFEHIADPLIDFSDEGMTVGTLGPLFADLRADLVPLVEAATSQPAPNDDCLHRRYPIAEQANFGDFLSRQIGYDFERGRQDTTHHPFMTKFSLGDVRITTRYREDDLGDGLFSTLHEAGHALYEQGIDPDLEGLPLASGTSSGMHESQSRLWENLVGRSRGFWQHYFPALHQAFPSQLDGVDPETFYKAINKVQAGLIRVDADELTYNLHVILRFDLELDLLEGRLAVRDLPDAWHARYESDLGLRAPDDRDGVLQDVHWYSGRIGGVFQGYTLGNIMAAQLFAGALAAEPDIPAQIARGDFGPLHGWLTDQVYRHGRKLTADQVLERATGGPLSTGPYLAYLRAKFGDLYGIA